MTITYNQQLNLGIQVTDLDRAIEWYGRVLGYMLQQRIDQIGFAILATGVPGVVLGLSSVEAPAGVGGVGMTWGVEDIDEAKAALEAHGVRGERRDIPGVVRLFEFADPDGNRLAFWASPAS